MSVERAFTTLAALLVVAAAVYLWWNNVSAAFVLGTLGSVAWLLSYRFRLRGKFPVRDDDEKQLDEEDFDEFHEQHENDPEAR